MKPEQSYIICATPRSGTTLLCDLLASCAVAGKPDSFFRQQSIHWWADYLKLSTRQWEGEDGFDLDYLQAVYREGMGSSDVFGMRLMWESTGYLFSRLADLFPGQSSDHERLRSAFGRVRFFHLSRQDKLAQSISLLKAEQSGLWHAHSDGRERERLKPGQNPEYDAQQLTESIAAYEADDAAWVNWFEQQQIEPLAITYEALSDKPRQTLAQILSFLDLNPAIAQTCVPETAKLGNADSREWARRFRAENPK